MIAPLTDLIGECGETKTTKKKKTKKKLFYALGSIIRPLKLLRK